LREKNKTSCLGTVSPDYLEIEREEKTDSKCCAVIDHGSQVGKGKDNVMREQPQVYEREGYS